MTSDERQVRLFRNGRNQAIRIPREFELDAEEAILRREGNCLVIEPLKERGLLRVLQSLPPVSADFPSVDDDLPQLMETDD